MTNFKDINGSPIHLGDAVQYVGTKHKELKSLSWFYVLSYIDEFGAEVLGAFNSSLEFLGFTWYSTDRNLSDIVVVF